MTPGYRAALAVEVLKARRAPVLPLTAVGFSVAPLVGALFMVILRDPERARSLGLIGQKAQVAAGSADWPAFFDLLAQAMAMGGAVLFAIVTLWVFGREWADRTIRITLAVPTPRWAVVAAKGTVVVGWCAFLTLWVFGLGLSVVSLLDLPLWSRELAVESAVRIGSVAALTVALQSVTAFVASAGRGYLAPFGWTLACLAAANILVVLGWGPWFPWAVPPLLSGALPDADPVSLTSIALVLFTGVLGSVATVRWWETADQAG